VVGKGSERERAALREKQAPSLTPPSMRKLK
jgi:hypothetical protein